MRVLSLYHFASRIVVWGMGWREYSEAELIRFLRAP